MTFTGVRISTHAGHPPAQRVALMTPPMATRSQDMQQTPHPLFSEPLLLLPFCGSTVVSPDV